MEWFPDEQFCVLKVLIARCMLFSWTKHSTSERLLKLPMGSVWREINRGGESKRGERMVTGFLSPLQKLCRGCLMDALPLFGQWITKTSCSVVIFDEFYGERFFLAYMPVCERKGLGADIREDVWQSGSNRELQYDVMERPPGWEMSYELDLSCRD